MKKDKLNICLSVVSIFLILLVVACGSKKEDAKVGNHPPEIHELSLLPLNPTIQSEITVRILASDKDGDPLSYRVKWFVNGKEIGEGMSLKYEEAKKGDRVSAEVTPYDGKEWGKPKKTGEVKIGGLPPKIISLKISPESLFATTPLVTVNAMVEDPDNDTVQLFVHWLVNDQVIPDTSNTLELKKFNLKKNDVITGAAFAWDGEFKSEPFTFELHIANSAPVLSADIDSVKASSESLYYQIPISDPDGDRLTFELLKAPSSVFIDKNTGVIYGSAGDVNTFEILVRAKDPDGAYLDAKFTMTAP
ncbi:MAG: putative Ig domain-containing protein [candidate division WOR-3 bacterium]|nr:putative Ig domain-containing protein [candidate division WOR-3 bacterium]